MRIEKITWQETRNRLTSMQLMKGSEDHPVIGQLQKNRIAKFIYRRRVLSSTTIYPYAVRFAKNGIRLKNKGIISPQTESIWHIPEKACHVVIYPSIPGKSLRDLFDEGDHGHLAMLTSYLAELHRLGIYFHSLHLGNVLLTDEGDLALLDIANLKTYGHPVSAWVRSRNLAHLLHHREDSARLERWGKTTFVRQYLEHAKLSPLPERRLKIHLARKVDFDF